eukprot:6193887-Pleurochrysis_carterae.AAC.3
MAVEHVVHQAQDSRYGNDRRHDMLQLLNLSPQQGTRTRTRARGRGDAHSTRARTPICSAAGTSRLSFCGNAEASATMPTVAAGMSRPRGDKRRESATTELATANAAVCEKQSPPPDAADVGAGAGVGTAVAVVAAPASVVVGRVDISPGCVDCAPRSSLTSLIPAK